MPHPARSLLVAELNELAAASGEPELDSLQAAIYLEDALDITLPDELLTSLELLTDEGVMKVWASSGRVSDCAS